MVKLSRSVSGTCCRTNSLLDSGRNFGFYSEKVRVNKQELEKLTQSLNVEDVTLVDKQSEFDNDDVSDLSSAGFCCRSWRLLEEKDAISGLVGIFEVIPRQRKLIFTQEYSLRPSNRVGCRQGGLSCPRPRPVFN